MQPDSPNAVRDVRIERGGKFSTMSGMQNAEHLNNVSFDTKWKGISYLRFFFGIVQSLLIAAATVEFR